MHESVEHALLCLYEPEAPPTQHEALPDGRCETSRDYCYHAVILIASGQCSTTGPSSPGPTGTGPLTGHPQGCPRSPQAGGSPRAAGGTDTCPGGPTPGEAPAHPQTGHTPERTGSEGSPSDLRTKRCVCDGTLPHNAEAWVAAEPPSDTYPATQTLQMHGCSLSA